MPYNREEIFQRVARGELGVKDALPLLEQLASMAMHFDLSMPYALSEGQKALWLVEQLAPNNSAYNIPMAYWVRPDVDTVALEYALQQVVDRHAILRSVFSNRGTEPMQHIATAHIILEQRLLDSADEEDIKQQVAQAARVPFDLKRGPLVRAILFRIPSADPLLLLNTHHIVIDGISIQILLRDLQAYYQAELQGESADLPVLATTYRDYVLWQQQLLESTEGARLRAYWREHLPGEIVPLDLPLDHPRPAIPSYHGALYAFDFPLPLSQALRTFALEHNTNTFVVVAALFVVLLHRYSRQEDILLGTPMSGRHETRFEDLVGYFINMLVLRCQLDAQLTFSALVEQMQETVLNAFDHSAYPHLALSRDRGSARLFHAALYFQNWVEELAEQTGTAEALFQQPYLGVHQEGEFDLTLEVLELQEKYALYLKYNPDLFEEVTIARMAGQLLALAQDALHTPEKAITTLALLSTLEKERMLYEWNQTAFVYPHRPVHELVSEQCHRTSEAIAIVYEGQSVTYRELQERVDILSMALRRRVRAGSLIGLLVERSAEMVIGLLSILQAGCTYVPLDPLYPTERLNYMLEDSGVALVLTQGTLCSRLTFPRTSMCLLDQEWEQIVADHQEERSQLLDERPFEERIAYVIYTSGSTGKPKGVEVLHQGLTNFLCSMQQILSFQADDCLLALTTICFDIAALEIYLPLICGGTIELLPTHTTKDGYLLKERLERSQATFVQATPATWEMLLAAQWQKRHEELTLLCGGESLSRTLADKLLHQVQTLWNVYGPTETTIWSTISKVIPGDSISIGRPLGNTTIYILDEYLQPVPIGIAGELYIGGDGVARGYHQRPELTHERFLQDPFRTAQKAHIYKTGDLARYRSDGTIECLGRIDQQIKIRGFRVELQEIEAVLRQQPGIAEAVVALREDQSGHKRLVAFLHCHDRMPPPKKTQVRSQLQQGLPEYMVPTRYIYLSRYPMTLNRKIDRKALTTLPLVDIEQSYGTHTDNDEVEHTAQEEIFCPKIQDVHKGIEKVIRDLSAMIAELLEEPDQVFHPDTNFGDYGFDSLLFTRLSTHLNQLYTITTNPTLFYQHNTIGSLAVYLHSTYAQQVVDTTHLEGSIEEKISLSSDDTSQYGHVSNEPIAIIGMWGKMPGSEDLTEFWQHLYEGNDLIQEIPLERWEWQKHIDQEASEAQRHAQKWGGFITDIDKFDASFFGISPREAELMDPQQRLVLEAVWKTFEDAGYKPSALSGSSTGVFIGVSGADFLGSTGDNIDMYTLTGIARSIIPNRVSYLFNLHGPSEPIDTACSSSLIAVHRAVQALRNHECSLALAGGVNAMLTPFATVAASLVGMLSPDGRCKAFDAAANGYVRGEGVATILLKPLSQALKDRDHVYALIRGSAENHGGRANSLTAPNPEAQTEVLIAAYENAQVDPATVGYIEAHGTGTALGDPIEITGLKNAFNTLFQRRGYALAEQQQAQCALGSVKTNIGHLEAAAGIAGLLKVVLAMQHCTLPGNLHLREVNPYIDLQGSPFILFKERCAWNALQDKQGHELPRRAGVSSFGFGGANAHVVLEAYGKQKVPLTIDDTIPDALVIFSAKDQSRLMNILALMVQFLDEAVNTPQSLLHLQDLAYTLQVGRDEMPERLALVVSSLEEFQGKLTALLAGQHSQERTYWGSIKARTSTASDGVSEEEKDLGTLAQAWVKGASVDWNRLYKGSVHPQRISLPTYPFARERYWREETIAPAPNEETARPKLHVMLDQNVSTLQAQRFLTRLQGDEFYVHDHVVGEQRILPGVAYLELARAAGELAGEQPVRALKEIMWIRPLIVGAAPYEVFTELIPTEHGVQFEISGLNARQERIIHAQGKLSYQDEDVSVEQIIDIQKLKQQLPDTQSGADCYQLFKTYHFAYGRSLQVIQELHLNDHEALARLRIPQAQLSTFPQFVLHPSLLDGALQTVILLMQRIEQGGDSQAFPFALGIVELLRPLTEQCYVYVQTVEEHQSGRSFSQKYHIFITDLDGNVLIALRNYVIRSLPRPQTGLVYLQSIWEAQEEKRRIADGQCILLFDNDPALVQELRRAHTVYLVGAGESYEQIDRYSFVIRPTELADYQRLLDVLAQNDSLPQYVLHCWVYNSAHIPARALDIWMKQGLGALFNISQALLHNKMYANKEIALLCLHDTLVNEESTNAMWSLSCALDGFFRTVRQEQPRFHYRLIEVSARLLAQQIIDIICREFGASDAPDTEIRYQELQRYSQHFHEMLPIQGGQQQVLPWRTNGVYVITGGMGGLGQIVARYLARNYRACLVLIGRSALSDVQRETIKELQALGAKVLFEQVDISNREEVIAVMARVRQHFAVLHGIIHAAGSVQDGWLINKKLVQGVLAPKVQGTLYLDEATAHDALDLFINFGSTAGAFGNPGQVDYAYANSFLNAFAEKRAALQVRGERAGRTLTINWPLWADGGMHVDEQITMQMKERMGMLPLPTSQGMKALEESLYLDTTQPIVLYGEKEKILQRIQHQGQGREEITATATITQSEVTTLQREHIQREDTQVQKKNHDVAIVTVQASSGEWLRARIEDYLKEVLARTTKMRTQKIVVSEPLENYGVDSVMIISLNTTLQEQFGELSKTLMFEYQTIEQLAGYFVEQHTARLIDLFGEPPRDHPTSTVGTSQSVMVEQDPQKPPIELSSEVLQSRVRFMKQEKTPGRGVAEEPVEPEATHKHVPDNDIAIIGVSGRYPQARNVEEFWQNLQQGKNCITEIPRERWDYRKYYHPEKGTRGKTYSIWGGFLDDVDAFDPLFFSISPLEAEMLDPQERLFIETVWHTLEDAGYTRKGLDQARVGVYVGVMWGQYQLYTGEVDEGVIITPASSYASIANRASYFFNFRGPSIALDTMCSSSLTTIHLACESIRSGEIDMAVAGGVNLTIHPHKHIFLSQTKFLSTEGLCRSFGDGGDGYVPGEGVGAVLLKSLSKAIADGDQIYAVIKGSAVNHGGKTNGYTVPNPSQQQGLIEEVLAKTGIHPRTISCIEAHGTGTALGDPIEITGLSKSFRAYTQEQRYCAIGSVKSNIGHCESAAGIAGITKAILQLKHQQLVPSIHAEVLNKNINFDTTPFYVQRTLQEWKQPEIDGVVYPRRIGVSSFGAGGANAHILMEEYSASTGVQIQPTHVLDDAIIVLSAKNEQRLVEYAQDMAAFLYHYATQHNTVKVSIPSPIAVLAHGGEETASKANGHDLHHFVRSSIAQELSSLLHVPLSDLDYTESIGEYGLDRVGMIALNNHLAKRFTIELIRETWDSQMSVDALTTLLIDQYSDQLIRSDKRGNGIDRVSSNGYTTEVLQPHWERISLLDLAYTLQVGREPMEERLAVVASSPQQLYETLQAYGQRKEQPGNLYRSEAKMRDSYTDVLLEGEEGRAFVRTLMHNKRYQKLALLWTSGIDIEWSLLYQGMPPRRISLPTYPFSKDRCWVPANLTTMSPRTSRLHPLLDEVVPHLSLHQGLTFKKTLSPFEAPLEGAQGEISLALQLGIVTAAATYTHEDGPIAIQELHCTQTIPLVEKKVLYTTLRAEQERIQYELYSVEAQGKQIHLTGHLLQVPMQEREQRISLDMLRQHCQHSVQVTPLSNTTSSCLGAAWSGNNEMLGRWQLSEAGHYSFPPALFAGMFQLIAALDGTCNPAHGPDINQLEMLHALPEQGYIYVKAVAKGQFSVAILDEQGLICGKLHQVVWISTQPKHDPLDRFFYAPQWVASTESAPVVQASTGMTLTICTRVSLHLAEAINAGSKGQIIILGQESCQRNEHTWEIRGEDMEAVKLVQDVSTIYYLSGLQQRNDLLSPQDCDRVQQEGVLSFYRLIKVLVAHGYGQRALTIKVITNNTLAVTSGQQTQPYAASLFGLAKSVSREYRQWQVACIDLDLDVAIEEHQMQQYEQMILSEPGLPHGKEIALRQGKRYERLLKPMAIAHAEKSPFKQQGVYMILGGMGNVGFKLSMYLSKTAQARVILVGRSPHSPAIEEKLQILRACGGDALYLSADMASIESMQAAVQQTLTHFGTLNGVFHSAMHFGYAKIASTTEEKFLAELAPKVRGSVVLHHILHDLPLDFVLYFSSGEAFTGNVGWGSYAAGCTFEDAYAASMRAQLPYPVQVINWGFWDNEQTEFANVLAAKGVYPIQTAEGMEAVCRILASGTDQVMALNVEDRVLAMMGVDTTALIQSMATSSRESGGSIPATSVPLVATPPVSSNGHTQKAIEEPSVVLSSMSREDIRERTYIYIKSTFARVLKMEATRIVHHEDFTNYGVDSLVVADIHKEFEKDLGKLNVTMLLEHSSVDALAGFLLENHEQVLRAYFLSLEEPASALVVQTNSMHDTFDNLDDLFASPAPVVPALAAITEQMVVANGHIDVSQHIALEAIELLRTVSAQELVQVLERYGDDYKDGTLNRLKQQRQAVSSVRDVEGNRHMLRHLFVRTEGGAGAEVLTAGTGAPVLLIPAIGLSAPVWTSQFEQWSTNHQIIVVHQQGYGLTEMNSDISFAGVARLFVDVLDRLGIDRPIHVVGSCFGGVAAQFLAKEYTDRVASLTLCGSFNQNFGLPEIDTSELTMDQMIEGAKMISAAINRDFDAIIQNAASSQHAAMFEQHRTLLVKSQCVNPLVVMRYITQILTLQGKEWLPKIKAPTLCIAGDLDTIVNPEVSRFISSQVADARYVEVSGAGHYLFLTHAQEFAHHVVPFIDGCEALQGGSR